MISRIGRPRAEHLIAAAVAGAYVALSLSGGGYSAGFRAGIAIVVWWAVIIGLAFGAFPRAFVPRAAVTTGLCLGGLTILGALSLLWANDDGRAFIEVSRAATYLGLFVLVVVVAPRGSARSWLVGLAIGLTAVACVAVASRLVPGAFPEQEVLTRLPAVASRLGYPIHYWNGLAACMAACAVLLIWLGAEGATRRARAVAVAGVPVVLLAMYLTFSRGGLIELAIGLLVLVALVRPRVRVVAGLVVGGAGAAALIALASTKESFRDGPLSSGAARAEGDELVLALILLTVAVALAHHALDPRVRRAVVSRHAARLSVAGVAVVVLAGALAVGPVETAGNLCEAPANLGQPSGDPNYSRLTSDAGTGRCQYWNAALDAYASNPVLGLGAGGYEAWWAKEGSLPNFILDAHSLFLETLAELGLAGLALLVGFIGLAAVTGLRRYRGIGADPAIGAALAVLTVGVASAALDWTWEIPAVFLPVILTAALLTGPATETFSGEGTRYTLGIATLLAGWLAIFLSGIVLLTQFKIDQSRDAARTGNLDEALEDARGASTVQPWAAFPHTQQALVQELRGDIPNALKSSRAARERAPDDWRLWIIEARLRRAAGDEAGAQRAAGRASELTRASPLFPRG